MPASRASKESLVDLLGIAVLWAVCVLAVNPVGNFPLNDDWSFGIAVERLLDTGVFRPTGWTSMSLLTNVLWGGIFSVPFGFSFNALRASTLSLSLIGILSTYLLMKELRQTRYLSILCALVVGFGPIYFALSNTFMTDVPFTALVTLCAVFFLRCLRSDSVSACWIGAVIAVAATLSRQLGLFVPLAFGLAYLLKNGLSGRSLLVSIAPVAVCLVALLMLRQWLALTDGTPALFGHASDQLIVAAFAPRVINFLVKNGLVGIMYMGLLLSPILIPVLFENERLRSNRRLLLFAAIAIVVISAIRYKFTGDLLMPLAGNIVDRAGIGPLTLHDAFFLNAGNVPVLPAEFWLIVTLISMLGAVVLLTIFLLAAGDVIAALRSRRESPHDFVLTFFLLCCIAYLVPIFIAGFFDRYLIAVMPFLAATTVLVLKPAAGDHSGLLPRLLSGALLVSLAFFAVSGTKDYLSWNRARWEALAYLSNVKKIAPQDVDGGFEFNGLLFYDPNYQRTEGKSWWWVRGDHYRIGFGPTPGYKIIKEYEYSRWLLPGVGRVVILQSALLD